MIDGRTCSPLSTRRRDGTPPTAAATVCSHPEGRRASTLNMNDPFRFGKESYRQLRSRVSGRERKRVFIARSLCPYCRVLTKHAGTRSVLRAVLASINSRHASGVHVHAPAMVNSAADFLCRAGEAAKTSARDPTQVRAQSARNTAGPVRPCLQARAHRPPIARSSAHA